MARNWTEEQIAAFVDGTMVGLEAEAMRKSIDEDPQARRYAESLGKLNSTLRTAFESPVGDPGQARIVSAIMGQDRNLIRPPFWRRPAVWVPTAVAATLVLTVGLQAFFLGQEGMVNRIATAGTVVSDGPLHLALETISSGLTSGEGIRPMTTFRDGSGRPCREFEIDRIALDGLDLGIACRDDVGSWRVEIVVVAPTQETSSNGYQPASGPDAHPIEEKLKALAATDPLTEPEEAELIRMGWPSER